MYCQVELLLKHGAAPDVASRAMGQTPVWLAAKFGHAGALRLLLAAVRGRGGPGGATASTKAGLTPLYVAAWNGHHEVLARAARGSRGRHTRDTKMTASP